jgi:hypothetical protein
MFRHWPGIAPALRQTYLHAMEGDTDAECCAKGIRPW